MSIEEIYFKLEIIENLLNKQNLLKKEVLNLTEAAIYLDISNSHLYKLTSSGAIPCYKPNGKKVYFNRLELDKWLLTSRRASHEDIEQQADEYLRKNGSARI